MMTWTQDEFRQIVNDIFDPSINGYINKPNTTGQDMSRTANKTYWERKKEKRTEEYIRVLEWRLQGARKNLEQASREIAQFESLIQDARNRQEECE